MQEITKQKYFFYIAFMLMASTFLRVVFNNLPPVFRSHHVWTILWVISLIFFYPKIFLNKAIIYLLGYGLLLFFATETIWSSMDDWNYKMLFLEFYNIAIGISVITYFYLSKDYFRLAKIAKWSILFLTITSIMSIVSSAIDPMYARNLGRGSDILSENEAILSFKQFGGGVYSTAGAFMCLFPVFIYYYKNSKISLFSRKQILTLSIITFLALIGMQIFGNILVATIFSIFALLGREKIRRSLLLLSIFISILVLIPKERYASGLRSISSSFKRDSELNYKFKDLANFIETDADLADNGTGTGGRVERYPQLIGTFIKNPWLGCYYSPNYDFSGYTEEGAHLYWMNKLTITGIIGLILFLIIPYYFIRNNLHRFDSTYKFYYILASLSILSYGFMKVIAGRETWYAFFIILPGLYYLPLLKSKYQVNESKANQAISGKKRI